MNTVELNQLKDALQEGDVVEVTFEKADGTERVMKCCITPYIVGESYEYKGTDRVTNPNTQHVWDIVNEGWRAFNYDKVLEWKVLSVDD